MSFCGIAVSYNCNNNTIIGNRVKDSCKYNIYVGWLDGGSYGASYNTVIGNNTSGASRLTNNSWDEILLEEGSTYNTVVGNILNASGTNKARYGVFEASGSDYNVISNNIIKSCVTKQVLISGSNTEVGHNIGY